MYAAPPINCRQSQTLRPRSSLIRIVPWLAILMCFIAINASAQVTVLLSLTNTVWKYDTNGTELHGTGWEQDDYNDAAWPQGNALIGFEDNAAILPLMHTRINRYIPGSTSIQVTTYWFRVHFNMPQDPVALGSSFSLIFSNHVDDGYALYLNGTEVDRFNMPGAIGSPLLASTMATAANPGGEPVRLVRNLGNPPSLRQGDNVIAVEVHQSGNTSSDLVWGAALFGVISFGPNIVDQPQSTNVVQGRAATLRVNAVGFPAPTYQWFFDDGLGGGFVALPNATNTTYTIPFMASTNAGNYYVRVSGFGAPVDSSVAAVTYTPDNVSPMALHATWTNDTTVLLVFNEVVGNPSDDAFSYQIRGDFVGTATIVNGTNVVITLPSGSPPRDPGLNYTLDIQAGADQFGNPLDPIILPIRSQLLLMDFNSSWRFDQTGVDRGTAWKDLGYNDGLWAAGPGLLGQETTGASVPLIQTDLRAQNEGGPNTIYFRGNFVAPTLSDILSLTFSHYVDDAVVVFINGQEAYRSTTPTLPPGQTFETQADGTVGDAAFEGPFTLPLSNMVAGVNLIAVELHSAGGTNSSDAVWGAQIAAVVNAVPQGAPVFLVQPSSKSAFEGGTANFYAVVTGQGPISYQWRKDGVDILNATNNTLGLTNITAGNVGAYDVVATSAAGSLDSNDAQLSLVPELSIRLLPNGDVELTWSAGPEWDLVESTVVTGPYTPVAGDPASGYTTTPSGTRFYQLRRP